MYIVKLTVKASDPNNSRVRYKNVHYTGMYLPEIEDKKVRHFKIQNEVEAKIIGELKRSNPNLHFDYSIKIEHNSMDFVVKENECFGS